MFYSLLRPLLFSLSPEKAHHFSMHLLQKMTDTQVGNFFLQQLIGKKTTNPFQLWDITFPNRVGLAAGFDKNAQYLSALQQLGFGFVEIGTVTPLPQAGNPLPRLFRLPADKALINRMGFNNDGLLAVSKRLEKRPEKLIVGGNIGKNKATPNENATSDYLKCLLGLYDLVDYFVVNVSSPNTPDLRSLQEKEPLQKLLESLKNAIAKQRITKPLLLKIAPDLDFPALDDIVEVALACNIEGIIATNTTISRENLLTSAKNLQKIGAGGLSGKPLLESANTVLQYLHHQSDGKIPLVGVGGIFSPEDALQKLRAGASLIQIYTGFIYNGASFPNEIASFLKKNAY
ncbi:MAG: quinone-dependent dihydroorotate dehydrogenase [Chitinophagales bacterium]|nr:quinone-dependent dihydroorotate dehydrogenase [Bacteroidota bacterium]MCB9043442.1 quinone-dependent dihydroorotate dehydrogenase [Chitinophagales bacterium]